MGASPYFYSVKYEQDENAALQKLRQREFEAGRYFPAQDFPQFPVNENTPSPGAQHASIEEALEASDATGTMSILDLVAVQDEADFLVAKRLSSDELVDVFGTDKPTETKVQERFEELFELIDRGQGICFSIYENDVPTKLIFVGYSVD